MFRSKKDVDRHVQKVFCKLNENEKTHRSYNVAKLYYQVGDYESTKRYVCKYLEVKDTSASAHKLLGQAYEALGQKEAAFNEYESSLLLDGKSVDLVLKVCELLVDLDIGMDSNKLKYWIERADNLFPHHQVVFQLKEKLLTIKKPNNNSEDLEALIASELAVKPIDVQLRIKLLNYYILERKLDKAYEHAINVEATVPHKDNIAWYQLLCELLTKCKENKSFDWSFWFFYISVLDKYAGLCLKEQGGEMKKSISEAAQAVFNFDQNLNEMKFKKFSKQHIFTEHLLTHMWGQLNFHLACLLLRKTKREQGSWSEAGRLCSPLLLTALHVAPLESRICLQLEDDKFKNHFNIWATEAAYRCCQAGYILQNYARDNVKKLMDRIDKFCSGQWRNRIYQRIFVTNIHLDHIENSFFCCHSAPNPALRMCTANQLKVYNQIAQEVRPSSLHHQIWLGMENRSQHKDAPYPDQTSRVFSKLAFSVFNTNLTAPDSLCLIDIDAFLNAAILCSSAVLEEQQLGSFMNPEKLPTLPIDLTATLSTSNQEKWWSTAYKMFSEQENMNGDIGELRQELQQGLETIRCIGNHGIHPVLLVHLARMFHYRAKIKEKDEPNSSKAGEWEARSELYWTAALPLLERLQNNQTLRMSPSKLFNYQGKEMNSFELTNALEEGKLLLAQRLIRDKQYEQAVDALQALKGPEASFQLAQIYKIFADEIVHSTPRESLTSEMRSQHIIMLSKARNCFYLTLDRLRSPGTNPKHPLNSELGTHITDIENELKRIDPDLGRGELSRNDIDGISDESYSPTHSVVDQAVTNPTLPMLTTLTGASNMLNTPQRNAHRTPKHASTPCKLQDYLNLSKNRTEARPSPERLDAQIRQIMQCRENDVQELVEQMKNMMVQMKTLNEKVDTLTKEVVDSRKENQKLQQQQQQRVQQQQQNVNPTVDPEDFYVLDDDEYVDLNYQNQPTGPTSSISGNIFTPQHARHPYSSLMYPSAATAFQYYQGGLPFTDPNAQAAISSLYPHTVYPMPMLYPNQTKVPDNPLQQSLFTSTLSSQLPDLMPASAANPSLQISLKQKIEAPSRIKSETTTVTTSTTTIIKDAPVNKAPPVNVVITTSDTLPTTVPSTQPTLSVTIPPQYRLGSGVAGTFSTTPITTTMMAVTTTTITKPLSPSNVPHCYQIPMPSKATIPTTVNLPPTTIYITPANVNVPPIYTNATASPSIVTVTHTTSGVSLSGQDNVISNKIYDKTDTTTSIYKPVESPNTSTEICEQEHDPIPNFVPVIPLPAKVKVTTGEEDEETLYCGRAKLFRFVDREWKERGVGDVKLLRNKEDKVRLLMRRDQILKICANHMLRSDMELSPMTNNNKAWLWVANDFADEEVKLEKLCIKFKTAEEAMAFKEAFDQAKLSLPAASPEKAPKTSEKVFTGDKDLSKTSKVQSTQQAKVSSSTEVAFSDKSKPITTLGGFSFSSKPIVQEVSDTEKNDSKKLEEPPKVSPFSTFSFTKSSNKSETKIAITTATSAATTSSGFVFATTPVTNSQSALITTTSNVSSILASPITVDQNSTALRKPRIPPPGSLKQGFEESLPQTEHEQKLFIGVASLQCQSVSDGNITMQWKSKGTGPIMLLLNIKTDKLRLLLTDNESSKIYGHNIPLDMVFTHKSGTAVVNWSVPGIAKEPSKTWSLHAATFSTPELALQFWTHVLNYQQKLAKGSSPTEVAKEFEKKSSTLSTENKDQKATEAKPTPLSELFKPPVGSWECSSCYMRNKATDIKCIACEAPSPSAASNKSSSTVVTNKTVDSGKPPLSELFKTPAGSWTCTGCYIVNSKTNIYCVACDSPKDPSQPPKPQQANIFQLNTSSSNVTPMTTFSFGIPKDSAKETSATSFNFRMSKDDKNANDSAKVTSKPEDAAGTNFVFGIPMQSSSTLNTGDSPFTFGSPSKSFGFNFTAKSPAKSPGGGGETSEDEVVESEDIHFSPVVPLPDKIEVKTGEEDEEVLYSHRAKLFRFDTASKEWKERGLGDIKLLCHKETGKLRLIMRRDHVLKLCLNHMLSNDLEFTSKDDKTWLWTTADYSEGEIEYWQFACRFKTSEIAADFKKAIDDARKNIKPLTISSSDSEKTDKPTTKTLIKSSSPIKEIEIIYETKVSPEEKAAALKLLLPENFYAYKQKEDCPGCRGCRKPSIVLYPDTVEQDLTKPVVSKEKVKTQSKIISSVDTNLPESTSEIQSVTQSTSVKNGFSFATPPSATTFKSSVPTSFDSFTMSFGTGDLKLFNDKKTTTFSFGMNPQLGNEATEKTMSNASLENLKICSPSNAQTTQVATFNTSSSGQPLFNQAASIFKTPTFTFDSNKSIFGGTSKASMKTPTGFGENSVSSTTTANSVSKTSTVVTTSAITSNESNSVFAGNSSFSKMTFGTASTFGNSTATTNIFSGTPASTTTNFFGGTTASTVTNFFSAITSTTTTNVFDGTTAVTATNVFGGTTPSTTTNVFGGLTPTTNIFGGTTMSNVFGTTAFGTKPVDNVQKTEDNANFFSASNVSFTALAAAAAQPEAFKVDPNFSFAGAGSSVFGSKSSLSLNSSSAVENKLLEDSVQKEDNEEDDGEVDNEQEHDPHFEPIVPLPDAIEVRTGEEDEERVFHHRAKLYRYDNATKEWKERGVGEMKILHHMNYGSYRLLLRREQVHKVVCNFLITPDVEFRPLSTSNQAWMWAGMNYAEQERCVEQLAVKFKSPELAREFKAHIDNIQEELREKKTTEGERCIGEAEDNEEHDRGNDVDEEQEEEEDDEEEEEEDDEDQEILPIIERRATVYARWPNDTNWENVGLGILAIYYDSDIYAERIILKLDNSEGFASNTIISIDTVMQVEGKECIWSGIDYALDPPVRRVLRAVFSSVQAAQEMHTFFEDGLDSAKQAGVVEYQETE